MQTVFSSVIFLLFPLTGSKLVVPHKAWQRYYIYYNFEDDFMYFVCSVFSKKICLRVNAPKATDPTDVKVLKPESLITLEES